MDFKCKSCGKEFVANYMTRCPACNGSFIVRKDFSGTPGMNMHSRATNPVIDADIVFPEVSSPSPEPDNTSISDSFSGGGGDSGGGGASGDF